MATDVGGARPLTQHLAGNGRSAVSYTLPAGLYQYIQSVVATIDTTAAGDVTPLLTVYDDAGIVVADKQQGQSIDAGGAGRATWALRLTDENLSGGDSTNVAHALFTGPEIEAGATKLLVPAIAGTIIIPLDFYLVPSADFNWREDVPGGSDATLKSPPSHGWWSFPFLGFGVTQWVSLSQMAGDPSTDGIERDLIGHRLEALIEAGAGLTVIAGTLEVFARWYRVRITN